MCLYSYLNNTAIHYNSNNDVCLKNIDENIPVAVEIREIIPLSCQLGKHEIIKSSLQGTNTKTNSKY